MQVQPQRLPTSFEFTGEVQPYRRVEVRSRIDGIIEARPFTEGSVVKPGQVLYRIERIRPEAAYQSALARAQNAKRTLDRLQPLVKENAVAQQDVDNAQAELSAAQSDLAEAKKNLDDAVVRAGIEGRVGRTNFEVGARVTGTDDLLTTIDVLDPIYVELPSHGAAAHHLEAEPRSQQADPAGKLALGAGHAARRHHPGLGPASSTSSPLRWILAPGPRSSVRCSRILTTSSSPASS